MRAVDTNVLVRLLARDGKRQLEAGELFVAGGGWVSTVVLVEAMWVLQSAYGRAPREIATAVEMLLEHEQLVLQDGNAVAAARALFVRKPSLGFSDAPAASAAWLERAALLGPSSPALAMAALAEARALSPGDPVVLRAQADLAEAGGEWLTALTALRALLAGRPADAPALELHAARVAQKAGDARAAREHAERAVDLQVPGAVALLEQVLEGSDDHFARALLAERAGRPLDAARLWERAGQPERMRAALEQAARDPAAPDEALQRLAEARLAAGDWSVEIFR